MDNNMENEGNVANNEAENAPIAENVGREPENNMMEQGSDNNVVEVENEEREDRTVALRDDTIDQDVDDEYLFHRFNQRFNDLRRYDKYSDCSFKIEGRIVNCHKLILMASSPVFEAMFYGPLAETQSVRIDDIRRQVFKKMLDFIYTGMLENNLPINEVLELYYCAQKYIIDGLEKCCIKQLYDRTSKNNVLKILRISVEMSLEEIVYSCVYSIQHWMNEGETFANYFLQKDSTQLSPKLVGLLIQEIFDFKDYNSIVSFVRAWCLSECSLRNLEPKKKNLKLILNECNLPKALLDVFLYQNHAVAKSPGTKTLIQRAYHKAARPLIVGEEMETQSSFWFDQFTTVSAFSINSRMMSADQDINSNETYDEEIFLEIWANGEMIHSKQHIIYNADYNNSISIQLANPFIFFPCVTYTLKLRWSEESNEYEYPRSVFADIAKYRGHRIRFSESTDLDLLQGSLLNGIVCDTSGFKVKFNI